MPIVLDPTKDVPQYAPAVINLFQELTKEFTEEELKKEIFKDKEEDAKAVVESLKKLSESARRINPKGANIKISEYWRGAFKEHEEQGKKLFDKIKDKLQKVQTATQQDGIKKKQIDKKIETAATDLLNELNAVLTAWGNVNTAVTEADKSPAAAPVAAPAPAAVTTPTIINVKAALMKNPKIGGLVSRNLNRITRGNTLIAAINRALAVPANKLILEPVLKSAGLDPNALPATLAESTTKKLKQYKAYYKAGLITENEYLAFLVKTRKFITEANVGTGAPATTPVAGAPAAPNSAKDKLGGLLAALAQDKGFMKSDYFKLVSELQAAAKSGAAAQVLSEQKKRLIKAKIKQRILSEGIDENGMINELAIFSALKGILGAVIGWIAGKFSNWFKGGPATVHVVPSNYVSNPNSQQVIASLIEQIAALESARQTPDGATVDQNNKPVDVNKVATAIENAKNSLEANKAKYASLQNEAKTLTAEITAAYTAHPNVTTTLNVAVNIVAPNTAPLAAALTEKENYLKS